MNANRLRSARRLRLFLLERFRLDDARRILLWAVLIGCLGALATIAFRAGVLWLEQLCFGRHDGLVRSAASLPWWQRMLVPAIGGVLAGSVLQWSERVFGAAHASDYMEAIMLGDGRLGARQSCARAASSALSIASGGSIGREGSMVQLAALAGSLLGRLRKMRTPQLRLMVACGAAAGITAAYNAPIAGALFVSEIVLGSIAMETLAPLLVSAVMAHLTVQILTGAGPVYHVPLVHLQLTQDVGMFALLGMLAGVLSPLFLWMLETSRGGFRKLALPLWCRLGVGGLIVGLLSIVDPAVWGNGYSVVDSIFQGGWGVQALCLILVLKVLATAATTGSGAVGGVFTPSLFVGAVLGAVFSAMCAALWPAALPLPACVAVGMGAFLAATTHAPLMSVMMISEMTGNYELIIPLMLAGVLALVVKRMFRERSVYASALPATRIEAVTAAQILRSGPPVFRIGESFAQVEQAFLLSRWPHVYALDAQGAFLGAVSLHDFVARVRSVADTAQAVPQDLIKHDYPRVTRSMSLGEVMQAFSGHKGERLPVLDADGMLLGYVSKTDLLLMFQERVAGLREAG